ncbi:hypothetical protein Q7O_002971 [Pectobacterium carotovorum subsp. carotovorum PCCS1]|nr:hypothetical protein [Pectobacterium carotovorum subsp. carotovorum PCCS1]
MFCKGNSVSGINPITATYHKQNTNDNHYHYSDECRDKSSIFSIA